MKRLGCRLLWGLVVGVCGSLLTACQALAPARVVSKAAARQSDKSERESVAATSLPYDKKDAGTFTFNVKIPARGKTKVTYRVRLRYC
jgi:hypothetical protein